MPGRVPRLSGSAKTVATPQTDSHRSQVPAVSKRFFGVRDLAFFRRLLRQVGSKTSGPADRKNSQSIRAFILQGQASVSTRLSAVQTEPDSRGTSPAMTCSVASADAPYSLTATHRRRRAPKPSSITFHASSTPLAGNSFSVKCPRAPPCPCHAQFSEDPFGLPLNSKFTSGEMAWSSTW